MSEVEREIRDMDNLISSLKDITDSLDGVVLGEYIGVMEAVTEEWESYTKKCMEEMAVEINNN